MFSRLLLALGLALTLAGCATTTATPPADDQFAEARRLYLAGEYQQAFPLLLGAARAGNPRAQYVVGYMYYLGEGVDQNADRALEWIKAAAEKGDPRAIEALGRLAARGTEPSVPQPQ